MGNLLNVTAVWEPDIAQLETADPVEGGPTGVDNRPHRQLAARTLWLKAQLEAAVEALAQRATLDHHHDLEDVDGLEEALQGRAARVHEHDLEEVAGLVAALNARHKKAGNEVHEGRFKVTATPVDNDDVLRLADILNRKAVPYASFVYCWCPISSDWGSDPQLVTLGGSNLLAVSGSDVGIAADSAAYLEVQTDGHYEFVGQFHSPSSNEDHRYWLEIWRRPAGTTGAQDQRIHYGRAFNGDGSILAPIVVVTSAVKGDRFYIKAIGQRASGAYLKVGFLGRQAATSPLAITTGDWAAMAANGQQYPKVVTLGLYAANATGAVTWSVTGGTAQAWASISGAVLTLSVPSTGAWTLDLRAVDADGAVATKTLNLALGAYQATTLAITTGNKAFDASSYPYAVEIGLASTGGETPITWAVVAGSNTTLPNAAITGSTLTGSAAAAGTFSVEVRATDSASTPQTVTKVLTVAVNDFALGGIGDDVCFEAGETYVLTAAGHGTLLEDVRPGDQVLALDERGHLLGHTTLRPATVTDLILRPAPADEPEGVLVAGVACTPGHPWGVPRAWCRADALRQGDLAMVLLEDGQHLAPAALQQVAPLGRPVGTCGNLGTSLGTYLVGATPEGPWHLVHNYLQADPRC